MAEKEENKFTDILIINKIFPDPADIFATSHQPFAAVKEHCLYVLDTNALLLPYTTSSNSLEEIKKVYEKLLNEKRLYIPGQVAREFAKNRPERIKEIFASLNRKKDKKQYAGKYAVLTVVDDYNKAVELEKNIDELQKEYSNKIASVIQQIKEWTWNDPVSQLYSLFAKGAVFEPEIDEAYLKEELAKRYTHKIPPGYKDGAKADDGIGDLLIWFTILELAKSQNKDVVFVSGDEKTDWFYKSEGQALYPRFELTSEFRAKTQRQSFHIIKLHQLLEVFGADMEVVKEVETNETFQVQPAITTMDQNQLLVGLQFNSAEKELIKNYIVSSRQLGLSKQSLFTVIQQHFGYKDAKTVQELIDMYYVYPPGL